MNDMIFSDLLATPGYEVEFAIGTTYSLSFEALLCVPISFGMLGELDEQTLNNPYYLLESIRRSSDRFAIFCNKGGIAVPSDAKTVYSLLENSIFEVLNEDEPHANFHPKIWVIKEHSIDDETERQIKLLVMSRNLTFDTCLDIAATLTAPLYRKHISKELMDKHQPLREMIEWLADYSVGEKRKEILQLAEDINCIGSFTVEDPFCNYDFFPFKYGKQLNEQINLERAMKGREMIIVSPFIDMLTLERLNEKSKNNKFGRSILITREDYVNQKVFDYYNVDEDAVYVVNESMLDNEVASINLHAKCYYVAEPLDNPYANYLYLGSANATKSAFGRNTEFLLRLQFKPYQKGVRDLVFSQFVNDEDRRFERVLQPMTDGLESVVYSQVDNLMIEATRCKYKAKAYEHEDGTYSISISCNKLPKDGNIYIAPLQLGKESIKKIETSVIFENMLPEYLSHLYILKVECKNKDGETEELSKIIKIKTSDIPEDRDMIIVQSLVNTKEKFLDYVTMMLSDNPMELIYEKERQKVAKGNSSNQTRKQPALYERLLRVAYEDPKMLKRVDDFVKEVKKDVVGESFEKMYSKFISIIKKLEKL